MGIAKLSQYSRKTKWTFRNKFWVKKEETEFLLFLKNFEKFKEQSNKSTYLMS